jgi:hypothetical protein
VSVWVLCPALIRAPVRYPVPASPLAALPVLSLASLPARLPALIVVSRLALALAPRQVQAPAAARGLPSRGPSDSPSTVPHAMTSGSLSAGPSAILSADPTSSPRSSHSVVLSGSPSVDSCSKLGAAPNNHRSAHLGLRLARPAPNSGPSSSPSPGPSRSPRTTE